MIRQATRWSGCMAVVLVLVCSLSCTKQQVSQPAWQSAYETWRSLGVHNYSIDQSRTCYCTHGGEVMRVRVESDTIAQVTRVFDSSVVADPYYFSVDSLFGIIRNHGTDSLVVQYHAQFGYPEYLDINPQYHPVDGGVLYQTSNLQIR